MSLTRREILSGLGSMLPASALIRFEQPVQSSDVVVVQVPGPIPYETAARIKEYAEQLWENRDEMPPKILILTDGITLRIERNIATVVMPEKRQS